MNDASSSARGTAGRGTGVEVSIPSLRVDVPSGAGRAAMRAAVSQALARACDEEPALRELSSDLRTQSIDRTTSSLVDAILTQMSTTSFLSPKS